VRRLGLESGSTLALDNLGRMIVGTDAGQILFPNDDTLAMASVPLDTVRRVRAIAQIEPDTFIAGGDFSGIYLIDRNRKVSQVAATPNGIYLLAADGNWIAYSTASSTEVALLKSYIELNEHGITALTLFSVFLSASAFLMALRRDRRQPLDKRH
jgi:hypothetical protein